MRDAVGAPPTHRVHGDGGAYVAGEWIDIEDCAEKFNVKGGSCGGDCAACPRSRSRTTAAKSDGSYDVVIIGGGCIGSAVARELAKTTASVLVLEAADDVTQGATKGNSGIVHAGFDDTPGSVRSQYCWPGNQMFSQLDRELHFGYVKNGSLVVAKGTEDEATLETLMKRGETNGVKNLRIVDQAELRKMEPHIHPDATGALWSPDAGTVVPYEYAIALAENAADNGVEFRTRREVTAIEAAPEGQGFVVKARQWETPEYVAATSGSISIRILSALMVAPAMAAASGGALAEAQLALAPASLAVGGAWVVALVAGVFLAVAYAIVASALGANGGGAPAAPVGSGGGASPCHRWWTAGPGLPLSSAALPWPRSRSSARSSSTARAQARTRSRRWSATTPSR